PRGAGPPRPAPASGDFLLERLVGFLAAPGRVGTPLCAPGRSNLLSWFHGIPSSFPHMDTTPPAIRIKNAPAGIAPAIFHRPDTLLEAEPARIGRMTKIFGR